MQMSINVYNHLQTEIYKEYICTFTYIQLLSVITSLLTNKYYIDRTKTKSDMCHLIRIKVFEKSSIKKVK
ncbi:hypothetical protein GCM10022258_18190 [Aquimarina gracilis]